MAITNANPATPHEPAVSVIDGDHKYIRCAVTHRHRSHPLGWVHIPRRFGSPVEQYSRVLQRTLCLELVHMHFRLARRAELVA
jgi:hypothetical protein